MTWNKVKEQTKNNILQAVLTVDLQEFGVSSAPLAISLNSPAKTVVVALNNSDTSYVLADLLHDFSEQILMGAALLAKAHGATQIVLHLPQSFEIPSDELTKTAEEHGIRIVCGMVNKRSYPGGAFHHIVTALQLTEAMQGEQQTVCYLCVNGAPLMPYDVSMTLAQIASAAGIDPEKVIAVQCGYHLGDRTLLKQTLAERTVPNGSIRFLDGRQCVIAHTRDQLLSSRKESCGKCVFCREGLNQLAGMLKDATEGRWVTKYPEIIREISSAMRFSTLCSMGQVAGDIALDCLEHFAGELEKHGKRNQCTTGICFSSKTVFVDPMRCTGCGNCLNVCPRDAIDGKTGYIPMVDEIGCDRCAKCLSVCEAEAICTTDRYLPRLPDRLTRAGKYKRF